MQLAGELRRALDGLCAVGAPEVRENGEWLAGLEGVHYEVSAQGEAALLHLWSTQQSLVRRVLRVAEESSERVVLEVAGWATRGARSLSSSRAALIAKRAASSANNFPADCAGS